MGKRTDALLRIVKADDTLAAYRQEFARAMRDSLHDQRRGMAEQIAEKVYADFRKKRLTGELDRLLKDYAGIEPATKPHRDSTRYNLDAWQPEKAAVSGAVKRVNPPSLYAHSILDPLASNIRQRGGGGALRAELAAILQTINEEKQSLDEMAKVAKSLLAGMEAMDSQPHPIVWQKLTAQKAGVLPHSPGVKYGTGAWPPSNKQERERAAALFPDYAYYLSLEDEVTLPELPDELQGFYTRKNELEDLHQKLLADWRRKAAEGNDPAFVLGEMEINNAVEAAERIL